MLRARGIRVRNPYGRQPERFREDRVWNGPAEIGQERSLLSRRRFNRSQRPFDPRIVNVESSRGDRMFDGHSDVIETVARKMFIQVLLSMSPVRADDEAKLAMRARRRRN